MAPRACPSHARASCSSSPAPRPTHGLGCFTVGRAALDSSTGSHPFPTPHVCAQPPSENAAAQACSAPRLPSGAYRTVPGSSARRHRMTGLHHRRTPFVIGTGLSPPCRRRTSGRDHRFSSDRTYRAAFPSHAISIVSYQSVSRSILRYATSASFQKLAELDYVASKHVGGPGEGRHCPQHFTLERALERSPSPVDIDVLSFAHHT
ncbi:hypothetical protein AcV7_005443 [Taiwanofungus camphoratus]|nr:hypothetical protein AcV7_005443 [Antrodia cinnamomea]